MANKQDLVYPLHFLDDLPLNHLPVHWLIQFDDVLDATKLHDALWRLLQIGDWKKLGGRLRKKGKGLEIHVPQQYSKDRLPFLYHHELLNIRMDQHPLAASFGRQSSTPYTQPLSPKLKSMMIPPQAPAKFKGWINTDVPMLWIRVTAFTNGSLVGMSWPHSLMDAAGARDLLQAWSLIVAGKEAELRPALNSHNDVMVEALSQEHKKEELLLDQYKLKGFNKIAFVLNYAVDIIWDNHPQVRRICIPQRVLANLRVEVSQSLDTEKQPFISDHCVLAAWFAHTLASARKRQRPLTLVSSMNGRFRLKAVQKDGVYLQNMILPSFTFVRKQNLQDKVGSIALSQQQQMDERITEAQTLTMLGMFREAYQKGQHPLLSLLVGEKNSVLIAFNNLTKVGAFQAVDFAGAVLEHDKEAGTPIGRPSNFTAHTEPEKLSSYVCVTGKDSKKDLWVVASLQTREWKKVEAELSRLSS